jgi:DNA mismatch endonuclease (patch repair protein)
MLSPKLVEVTPDAEQKLMDIVPREKRSAMMANIGSRDTRPELAVRRAAHRLGLRFRLHRRDLPGSPDLVFPRRKTALFVHGCYWHRHTGCKYAYTPKSNVEFWLNKLQTNVSQDIRVRQELEDGGWNVVVIWECETKDAKIITDVLMHEVCNAAR